MLVILSQHFGLQGYDLPGKSPFSFVIAIVVSLLLIIFVFRRKAMRFKKQVQELYEQSLKDVITVKSTSDKITLTCNCKSWMNHWEKGFGNYSRYCTVIGCLEDSNLVAGHVRKTNQADTAIYIVPLCREHNSSAAEMRVSESHLVAAIRDE
jgi:hypothetical protein